MNTITFIPDDNLSLIPSIAGANIITAEALEGLLTGLVADLETTITPRLGVMNEKEVEDLAFATKRLRSIQISIEKQSKDQRDEANKTSKASTTMQNKLCGILQPAIDKYKKVIAENEARLSREARAGFLPMRRDALAAIGDSVEVSDDTILDMDEEQFATYRAGRVTEKQAADQAAEEKRQAEAKRAEDIRLAKEEATKEAERKAEEARVEAEKEAERRVQEEKDKAAQAIKGAEEKAKREEVARETARVEAERKAEEARVAQEQDASFQSWKDEMASKGATDFITIDGTVTAVAIIGKFTK
jgi:hypothetical protein